MHKINICAIQIVKAQLGFKPGGTEGNINMRNTTYTFMQSTRLEKKSTDKVSYKSKSVSVKRFRNIKMAKACRPVSNEGLCLLPGLTPHRH